MPASPTSVLMTADAVGGVWDYALELCAGLGREGVSTTLAVLGPEPSPDRRAAAGAIDGLRVVAVGGRLEWMSEPWDDVDRAGTRLLELEAEIGADVVHLNGYAHGTLPWRAPVIMVAHSCVCSWWQAVHGRPAPPEWNTYRDRVRAGLRCANAVVAPTRAMGDALGVHYGCHASATIANGRSAVVSAARDRAPLIFAAGRLWDAAKNIRLLVDAAADMAWPVFIAGDADRPGESRPIVNAAAADRDPITWLGRLPSDELRRWLARASICVLPSKYEPFGLTALEAALAGCALVLGDIPSLRELWDGAAVFAPPDDPRALAGTVAGLTGDADRLTEYARRARRRAAGFTPERMTAAYLDLYASTRRIPVAPGAQGAPCAS